jgi:hypothetical protein
LDRSSFDDVILVQDDFVTGHDTGSDDVCPISRQGRLADGKASSIGGDALPGHLERARPLASSSFRPWRDGADESASADRESRGFARRNQAETPADESNRKSSAAGTVTDSPEP